MPSLRFQPFVVLSLKSEQLLLHRACHDKREARRDLALLTIGEYQLSIEFRIEREAESLRVLPQSVALRDAREHFERVAHDLAVPLACHVELRVIRKGPRERSRAELRGKRGEKLLRRVPDDRVEAVMPEAPHLDERRMTRAHELAREIEDAGDVIRIDVRHHQQIDRQRLLRPQSARLPELHESRSQVVGVRAVGAAIDDRELRSRFRAEVKKQTVAVTRAAHFETEDLRRLRSRSWRPV